MTTIPAATVRITVVDHHTIRVQVGDRRFLVESSCPHRGAGSSSLTSTPARCA